MPSRFLPTHKSPTHKKAGRHVACGCPLGIKKTDTKMNYKIIWIIFGLIINNLELFSQTKISDKQEIYGVWSKQNSPYIIEGEAIIPIGKTLTIESGVVIKFKTDESTERSFIKISEHTSNFGYLRIKGQIIANGSENDKIIFTRLGDEKYWGIILFDRSSDTCRLSHCKIEYANDLNPCIDSSVYNQASGAISFQRTEKPILIEYCEITKCDQGINCINSKNVHIEYCLIHNNASLGIYNGYTSELVVNHCTLFNNQFSAYISKTEIKNTIIWTENDECGFYANPGINCENSIIKGYYDLCNSCFDKNPRFVNAKRLDFRLRKSSPCRNKGINHSKGFTSEDNTDIGAIQFKTT